MNSRFSHICHFPFLLAALLSVQVAIAEPASVSVAKPTMQSLQQQLRLTGNVEANQDAALASLESGLIATVHAEVGDSVKQGQLLLTLDDKLAQLRLKELQALLSAARVATSEALRRYQEVIALSESQVVAQTLIAERQAQFAAAEAEEQRQQASVAVQEEVVARHKLYAPFSGIIASRSADTGEWVSQQSNLFQLISDKGWRLSVEVPQEYFPLLSGQTEVNVRVIPDITGVPAFESSLERLVSVSNQQSRTLTAHITVPDISGLVVGMSARAEIMLPSREDSVGWLPRSALKFHPDGGFSVFTVTSNRAQRVLVELIEQQANQVAVNNISADSSYVVSGVELLKDGDPVAVLEGAQ